MKTIILSSLTLLLLVSCSKQTTNTLLLEELYVESHVRLGPAKPLSDASYYYTKDYFPIKSTVFGEDKELGTLIVQKVLKDGIPVMRYNGYWDSYYNTNDDTLSLEKLYRNLTIYDTDKELDLSLIKYLDLYSVITHEHWSFNAKKNTFTKEVVQCAPVISTTDNNGNPISQVCFMKETSPSKKGQFKKMATISYEYIFTPEYPALPADENPLMPYLNNYSRMAMLNAMLENCEEGMPVYDFETGASLAFDDVKKKYCDFIFDDIDGYDFFLKEFEGQIKSFIFTENIYFNKETLAIRKEVLSAAPVLWNNEDTPFNSDKRKEILFEYKFK